MYHQFLRQCLISLLSLVVFWQNAAMAQAQAEEWKWVDIKTLNVQGRGWENGGDFFRRLPAKAEGSVSPTVWRLSQHTSGMYVRFKTDASSLKAKWSLTGQNLSMPHFSATGVSGIDLYVKTEKGEWHWLSVGQPINFPENEATFFTD